ncbi:unnamed protein product [Polarella glacialis]|uniref:Pseudouridine synthase RsuA/RluA-like domain-containing protein n=1 Tax=Polarella glacialis TaxID=89957 RepID=A0A813G047_POLGL|nr:unnamed protein product [Polarella glacialis]
MSKLQSQQNAAADEAVAQAASHRNVDHSPKEAVANTAQRACGRCLVKGDVVYSTVVTGAGYVAMCYFSSELCNSMGIHQGMEGAVAESKNAAEHSAASAVLSVLGVECGPKKSKVSTEAPIQSPLGLQGPPSGAKKTTAPKAKNAPCRVFALFKPTGMVTTMSTDPSKGSCDMAAWINSILPGQRLSVIGGLDKNASGLMLVTNDGQFAAGVTASHGCEKEYWCGVDVASNVDAYSMVSGTCAQLLGGFEHDHPTKPKPAKILGRAKNARKLLPKEEASALSHADFQGTCLFFSVTMDTGSFRVVKSMMAAAGAPSATQHLERIGGLRLTELQLWNPGSHVELSSEDIELLRSSCDGFAQFQ